MASENPFSGAILDEAANISLPLTPSPDKTINIAPTTTITTATTPKSGKKSTPRSRKRRPSADPEGSYTPSKRTSLPRSTQKSNNHAPLYNLHRYRAEDPTDKDYKARYTRPKSIVRPRPRPQTRSGAGQDEDEIPGTCIAVCPHPFDENEDMIACDGEACLEANRWFHIQCVGFRSMPTVLRKDDETIKWFCFECRVKNGRGRDSDGIVFEGEDDDEADDQ